jgi:hypothetical protein
MHDRVSAVTVIFILMITALSEKTLK